VEQVLLGPHSKVQESAHVMLPTKKQEMGGKGKKPNIKQTCHVIFAPRRNQSL